MKTILAAAVLSIAHCLTNAAEMSYHFTGILTSVTDQHRFLSGQFFAGNAIDGTFVYETLTPEGPTSIGNPTFGIYSAIKYFSVSVNGLKFQGSPNSLPGYLQVWDDYLVNPSIVDAVTFSSPLDYTPPILGMGPGTVVGSADINLFDFSHTASQNGKAIPSVIHFPSYGTPVFSALQLNVNTNEAFFLNGEIRTLTAIPEPGSKVLILFGISLLAMLVAKRKEA